MYEIDEYYLKEKFDGIKKIGIGELISKITNFKITNKEIVTTFSQGEDIVLRNHNLKESDAYNVTPEPKENENLKQWFELTVEITHDKRFKTLDSVILRDNQLPDNCFADQERRDLYANPKLYPFEHEGRLAWIRLLMHQENNRPNRWLYDEFFELLLCICRAIKRNNLNNVEYRAETDWVFLNVGDTYYGKSVQYSRYYEISTTGVFSNPIYKTDIEIIDEVFLIFDK